MKVVFAPDSFKGSINALRAAQELARGWSCVREQDELVLAPMADGGEGTLEAVRSAHEDSQFMPIVVHGPDGQAVDTSWLLVRSEAGDTGVVELSRTSGLTLLSTPLPRDAHTIGCGEAIGAALDGGVSRIVVALGGSSSSDGGVGILSALGARFLDAGGQEIMPGNRGVAAIVAVDLSALHPLPREGVTVLTDVTNPLLGPLGTVAVFGPQKGAQTEELRAMEESLIHFARVTGGDAQQPGSGAAGGAGYGLALWGAQLVSGAAFIAEAIGLASTLADADWVITGEGKFDNQSSDGKVATHVQGIADRLGVSTALVAGLIDAESRDFNHAVSLTQLAGSSALAMEAPEYWLQKAGQQLAKFADQ
ncbi:glycerate kinase [Lysinibacter sp. HNR]|uniref:glycerate kinase n=1 Tax=Lysinibacter sp. HNR TaxID=3031408 RepID=UPI00325B392B